MTEKQTKFVRIGLGIANAVGVPVSMYLTYKAANKSAIKLKDSKDLSFKDKFKKTWKLYVPAVVAGCVTMSSGTANCIISKRVEASLVAAYMSADQAYRKYHDKVKQVIGKEKENQIQDELAMEEYEAQKEKMPYEKDRVLGYERHVGFFLYEEHKLAEATLELNRKLTGGGYDCPCLYTLAEFFDDLGAKFLNPDIDYNRLNYGWSMDYLDEMEDHIWVESWAHKPEMDGNGNLFTRIEFSVDPIWSPDKWYDWAVQGLMSIEEYNEGREDIPDEI